MSANRGILKIFDYAKVIGTLDSDPTNHSSSIITRITPPRSSTSPSPSCVSPTESSDNSNVTDAFYKTKQQKIKTTTV